MRDLRYLQLYYLAWTFTISFAVHNATEGIAIASPAIISKSRFSTIQSLVLLSLLAGLPTSLGAYAGIANQIFLAFLNVVA
ncbi:MAG: hypothetical protein QXG62_06595 [Saccharolobus sp.]